MRIWGGGNFRLSEYEWEISAVILSTLFFYKWSRNTGVVSSSPVWLDPMLIILMSGPFGRCSCWWCWVEKYDRLNIIYTTTFYRSCYTVGGSDLALYSRWLAFWSALTESNPSRGLSKIVVRCRIFFFYLQRSLNQS